LHIHDLHCGGVKIADAINVTFYLFFAFVSLLA
jgi:hypothetical protein